MRRFFEERQSAVDVLARAPQHAGSTRLSHTRTAGSMAPASQRQPALIAHPMANPTFGPAPSAGLGAPLIRNRQDGPSSGGLGPAGTSAGGDGHGAPKRKRVPIEIVLEDD